MPGRPERGEGVAAAGRRMLDRLDRRTGGAQDRGPARLIEHGVQEERAAAPGTHRLQAAEIAVRVDGEEGSARGRQSVDHLDPRIARSGERTSRAVSPVARTGVVPESWGW